MAKTDAGKDMDRLKEARKDFVAKLPDEQLIGGASSQWPLIVNMDDILLESLRRLKKSLDIFNKSSARYSRSIILLTLAMISLMVIQILKLL